MNTVGETAIAQLTYYKDFEIAIDPEKLHSKGLSCS
jgi:hypothetical protein